MSISLVFSKIIVQRLNVCLCLFSDSRVVIIIISDTCVCGRWPFRCTCRSVVLSGTRWPSRPCSFDLSVWRSFFSGTAHGHSSPLSQQRTRQEQYCTPVSPVSPRIRANRFTYTLTSCTQSVRLYLLCSRTVKTSPKYFFHHRLSMQKQRHSHKH